MKWSAKIAIIALLGLIASKGGGMLFATLSRLAIPFVLIYIGYRVAKSLFLLPHQQKRQDFPHQEKKSRPSTETTIEICPACGHEKGNPTCRSCGNS